MASSACRSLTRSLPVGASAAAIVGLATFFDRRSEGAERARQRHIGEVSLLFSGDGGLRPPSLWRTGAALCEAPAVPVAPAAAKYQPKDPAEPVSDPPAVVSNDDPSRLSGGMKQEEEGSVSPGDEQL